VNSGAGLPEPGRLWPHSQWSERLLRIFTSGHSDVAVTAKNDIMSAARVSPPHGGNVFVGRKTAPSTREWRQFNLIVPVIRLDPASGLLISDSIASPRPFGSGIMAIPRRPSIQAPAAAAARDITVETPHGDIVSTLGGIQQFALNVRWQADRPLT